MRADRRRLLLRVGAALYAWHASFEVQRTGVPTTPADLDAWVQSDLHGYAADTVATLAPDCEADPRAEIPCLPEDVLGFLADRPGKVAAELAVAR